MSKDVLVGAVNIAPGFGADVLIMVNGERRIRFSAHDGTAYVRTEAGESGGWQNAHHHQGVSETYIVQKGWIAYAERIEENNYRLQRCGEGALFTSRTGIDHNVYMPSGAVIHTVKHGIPVGNPLKKGNDWFDADPAFDRWTKSLPEAVLLNAAESGSTTE